MSDNSTKRRGLGRGLSALIGDAQPLPAHTDTEELPSTLSTASQVGDLVRSIAVDRIAPNPKQPRALFDEESLTELAASIREHGILQPLIVTRQPNEEDLYWLVAGERRWRAAQLARLYEVPALVREASSQQMMEWALVENIQRADLNAIEEANAYHSLNSEFGLRHEEIAVRVGKSRSAITNTMRLLNLPLNVQAAVIERRISEGHARVLATPKLDEAMIERAFAEIIARNLTVRQAELLVRDLLDPPKPKPNEPEVISEQLQTHLSQMENRFRNALGTKVSLNRNSDGSGKLVVHFYNDQDLDSIFRVITKQSEDE
ncbi:MAG: ParB/RepB/Spo0J family partition protein [Caldilineaceae bacterium]